MAKKSKLKASPRSRSHELWSLVAAVVFMELLIQLLSGWSLTLPRLLVVLLFSVCYGAVLAALADLLSFWRGKRVIICLLLAVLGLLFATEYFLNTSYRTYMDFESILSGGGNVATEFRSVVFSLVFRRFWVIALFQLPTLLYGLFGKNRSPLDGRSFLRLLGSILIGAAAFGLALLVVNTSVDKAKYHDEFNFDAACRSFGILTGCRLDLSHTKTETELTFQTVEPDEDEEEEEPEPEPAPEPAPKPAAKVRTAPIEDERPPLPEEPPMMDEGDRVFDIPAPPPASQVPAKKAEVPAQAGGDTALWAQLINDYKGRLPVNHRVFLNMAKGVLDGDVLTVYCNNDFVKDSLNNESVLSVLREVTGKAAGCNVRVVLTVGAVEAAAKPKAAAPIEKAPSKPMVTETPPWEAPTPPFTQDRLDELEKSGSRLDHFKIK